MGIIIYVVESARQDGIVLMRVVLLLFSVGYKKGRILNKFEQGRTIKGRISLHGK